jgi:hypothetical protein
MTTHRIRGIRLASAGSPRVEGEAEPRRTGRGSAAARLPRMLICLEQVRTL